MFYETRMKFFLKKVSATIDTYENEILASSQSKKEYIQGIIKTRIPKDFGSDHFIDRKSVLWGMEGKAIIDLLPSDLKKDPYREAKKLIRNSVEKIFLGAENEIHIELKRTSLYENIKKNHNSEHGAFFNAYKDLTSVFATEYPQFTDLVKKAYGYARIELAAVLLLQGILSDSQFNDEQKLFPDIDVKKFIDLNSDYWDDLDPSDSGSKDSQFHGEASTFISSYFLDAEEKKMLGAKGFQG